MGLSRRELLSQLGINPLVDPVIELAYARVEEKIWRENLDSSVHGNHWHTSFHASEFPGDTPKACGRKAIYSLLDIPDRDPVEPRGRAIMDAGKALEVEIVRRLHEAGVLISAGPDDPVQTGFVVPEVWLTGNCDAIIQPPGWNKGHVIEIKGKDPDKIKEMQRAQRGPDPEHVNQLRTYIGLANAVSSVMWPKLEPVTDGSLLYVDRSRPRNTFEFYYEINDHFMQTGLARLAEWKELFLEEKLPDRPKRWRWTEEPCEWCPVKKLCKKDLKEDVYDLPESNAVKFAKEIRPSYDYEATRDAVINRWKGD